MIVWLIAICLFWLLTAIYLGGLNLDDALRSVGRPPAPSGGLRLRRAGVRGRA